MPRPRARGRIRATSALIRTPTPAQVSDEEMQDANDSRPETPPQEEDEEDDDEGDQGTPAADSNGQQSGSEQSSPRPVEQIPRKRRLGRPSRGRTQDGSGSRQDDDRGSDMGTPQKRKRGRPVGSGGGFRGRPRHSLPVGPLKVKVDKEGRMLDVVDDEVDLPEDPEGEKKVDKFGQLQGGRDYRVRVFTVKNRGKRLYMLSTEPARCCGFRDSYLFFTKHLQLHKVIVEEEEKRDLIERKVIPHSYKGRSIGVVTARSVFREFGARIVVGGRRIIDDYYVQAARDRGDVEGELADPHDVGPDKGKDYNKNQYVAWHGASAVYHTGGPTVPAMNGKPVIGKRKVPITSSNWQIEHARAASRFNSVIAANRKATLNGIYDPHTNVMHYPKATQPSHAKWEQLDSAYDPSNNLTNGVNSLTNGVHDVTLNTTTTTINTQPSPPSNTHFPPVSRVISRNFLVVDTTFKSPPTANLGIPGPDSDTSNAEPNGLPNISDDILAELPAECRKAFDEAKAQQQRWRAEWGCEVDDCARGDLKIGFLGFPV